MAATPAVDVVAAFGMHDEALSRTTAIHTAACMWLSNGSEVVYEKMKTCPCFHWCTSTSAKPACLLLPLPVYTLVTLVLCVVQESGAAAVLVHTTGLCIASCCCSAANIRCLTCCMLSGCLHLCFFVPYRLCTAHHVPPNPISSPTRLPLPHAHTHTVVQANIKESRFSLDFFKSFDLVLNGLDNMDARRHVNRLCVAAGVPLVESGTAGYVGQVGGRGLRQQSGSCALICYCEKEIGVTRVLVVFGSVWCQPALQGGVCSASYWVAW